jgi:FHS family L-fucose permease-like MFS transporter
MSDMAAEKPRLLPKGIIIPFVLLSSCFMWWGIANNITDPLVRVFKAVFGELTTFQASLIQFAFYGGYFCMAIPGGIIARRFSYKTGVLVGLGIYALGCLLLYPSTVAEKFLFFCISYWVLACGLGVLETNANPYILALGDKRTATMRLNLAQAFNPIGSVIGILLCRYMILARLPQVDGEIVIQESEKADALNIVIYPYLTVAACLLVVWFLILITKMPKLAEERTEGHSTGAFGRLLRNGNYVFAVVAQFFYVGAQITVWTYTNFYIPEHLPVSADETLRYHTVALILFGASRWVFTGLMKIFKASTLLLVAASAAVLCSLGVIYGGDVSSFSIGGIPFSLGVLCLIGISVFMSLMFPTIFGLGCQGLSEDDTKLGASGLIMAILGGAIITPSQGLLIDRWGVDLSYLLPLICFAVIGAYAFAAGKIERSHLTD